MNIKIRYYDRRNDLMHYHLETTIYSDGSFGANSYDSEWMIFAGVEVDLQNSNHNCFTNDIIQGRLYTDALASEILVKKVEFSNVWFQFGVEHNSAWYGLNEFDSFEIIGNIYQNKDLLKE